MAIDQPARRELRERLEPVIGSLSTDTLMEELSPLTRLGALAVGAARF